MEMVILLVMLENLVGTVILGLNSLDIDGVLAGDQSGSAISFSSDGNTLAIGTRADGAEGADTYFNWDGNNWIQLGQDIDGDETNDHFGISVSLSSDGNIVAIGASTHAIQMMS